MYNGYIIIDNGYKLVYNDSCIMVDTNNDGC